MWVHTGWGGPPLGGESIPAAASTTSGVAVTTTSVADLPPTEPSTAVQATTTAPSSPPSDLPVNFPSDFPRSLVTLDDIQPWRATESGAGDHTIQAQFATLPPPQTLLDAENSIANELVADDWTVHEGSVFDNYDQMEHEGLVISGHGWSGGIAIAFEEWGEVPGGTIPVYDADMTLSQCANCT